MNVTRIIAVLAALFSLSAFGAANPARDFTLRLMGEPETLDWNKAHTSIETWVLMNVMEGLLSFDSNMKVVPELAQSWKVSADGKTYTFKLRKNVKWSDGVPLKARDFVYSWKRLLSPATAASYAYLLYDVVNAEAYSKGKLKDFGSVGVKAPDDSTLVVKLSHPVAYWIYLPTFWVTFPLREDIVAKYGESWASPGKMVTVGPFNLAEHVVESKIVLKTNPNYYGVRGNIENVVCLIIQDDSTALTLYESGKLDFLTDISTLDLKRLAGRPDLRTFPYFKTGYIGFVVSKPPMDNVKLRRAIAMAIDKARFGEIMHGGQEPATSWVPPRMLAHSANSGLSYDPAKAKEELKASGVDVSKPIEMTLPNFDKSLILSQFIQGELKKNLNLTLNLQPYDHKTFRAQVAMKAYPIFLLSWSGDYPDPDDFMSVFLGEAGNNRTGWKDEKYDEMVLSARGSQDNKSRERSYLDAQKILLEDDAVVIPLYYEPNMALVRSRVQGLELNPLNYLLLRKVKIE